MTVAAPDAAVPQPAPAAPAVSPLDTEAIVAAIGLDAFVHRTLHTVHGHHIERASGLQAEVTRKIHLFLNREEAAPPSELPPFDFDEVVKAVEAPHPEDEREIAAFGVAHDAAVQADVKVQQLRAYVSSKVPKRTYQSLTGPEEGEPARSDIARFRRLWVIACDPLSILDDLNEFAVSRDQVAAISDMYPGIWGLFWPTCQEQFARRAATSRGTWKLSRKKENLLRVLVKQEAQNKALVQACQQIFDEANAAINAAKNPTQPIGNGPSTSSDDADSNATQSQRVSDN